MEKINGEEYKLTPNEFNILNNIKELIWETNLKLERNNILITDIEYYENIWDNIENILDNLWIDYNLTEINFLWSNSIVIDLWGNYLKIICDVKIIDIIKNKINKIINK
jgi:hypothetical protein